MYIVSVLNAKGGVAKTTTALALADYLSKTHRVLFIDLDPQANATSTLLSLDIGQEPEDPTLFDVFNDFVMRSKKTIKSALRPSELKNLDLCPAHLDLEPYKEFFKLKMSRPVELLPDVLEPVQKDYDFCIVDCPADVSVYVESAIACADLNIVPTTFDLYGFQALQIVLKFMFSIHKSNEYDKFRVLYTRVKSSATKIQQEMAHYMESFESRGFVLPFKVKEEQAVTNAQSKHDSLMLSPGYKNSSARMAYKKLGEFVKEQANV